MKLKTKIIKVLWPKDEKAATDWFILSTTDGCAKGNCNFRPEPNQKVILEGGYTLYKGQKEYKFKSLMLDIPTDLRTLLNYACELTLGIGDATALKIWEKFGALWCRIEDNQTLLNIESEDIPKLNNAKLEKLRLTLNNLDLRREQTKVITYLMNIGSTMNMANAAWEKWESETMAAVEKNCYILAELPHYSFNHVDKLIRHKFKIADNDQRRIKAAVVYAMSQVCGNGSTVVNWDVLKGSVITYTGANVKLIVNVVKDMFENLELHAFQKSKRIALQRDYENEKTIWEFVK